MALNFGLLNTDIPAQIGAMPGNALAARRQRIQQDEDRTMGREQAQMQNALARMQMQKGQRDMDADDAMRTAAAGGGEWSEVIDRVRGVDPVRALDLEAKVGTVQSSKAAAKAAVTKQAWDKLERYRQAGLQSVQTPEQYAAWLQQQHTDPELAPVMEMLPPLEESLRTIPRDPQQFEKFRQQGMLGMEKWLQMNKPAAPSNIAQLIAERDALPPGHPQRATYDQAISKETSHRPATTLNVDMTLEKEEGKQKGKANVELYSEVRNSASVARKLNAQLESQSRTLDSGFETGFGTKWKASAAAALGALGVQDAEQYATNAQTFNAAAKEVVLQKQLAQKGPQTESDAKRIEETGTQLGSTPQANRFIMDIARAQNDRDIKQQEFFDRYWRENKTYEGAESAWYAGEGGTSLFESPRLKKYGSPSTPSTPSTPSRPGAAFDSMPNPAQYSGKAITDTASGIRYRSNGSQWVRE